VVYGSPRLLSKPIIVSIAVRSYSTGSVTGSSSVGGFIGTELGTTVTDCYWDTESSGQSSSASTATALTTSEMQGSSASTNMSGFDFTGTWETVESGDVYGSTETVDGYPILQSLDGETQVLAQGAKLIPQGLFVWTGSTWKKVAGV